MREELNRVKNITSRFCLWHIYTQPNTTNSNTIWENEPIIVLKVFGSTVALKMSEKNVKTVADMKQ